LLWESFLIEAVLREASGGIVANPGDIDPAKAINFDQDEARERVRRQKAAEEDEKQRAQEQEDLRRANIRKLLHYADKELEEIRNPIVSEFVVTEIWWSEVGLFRKRHEERRRQTRYCGSWLALVCTIHEGSGSSRRGLVKLREPQVGYAFADINAWDPRNVGYIAQELTDRHGRETFLQAPDHRSFQIFASLKEIDEAMPVEKGGIYLEGVMNFSPNTIASGHGYTKTIPQRRIG
jgi:hypothetical protein